MPNATVVSSVARDVGGVLLLVPIAVAAARSSLVRRDRVLASMTALAVIASTLVIVGVVLSSFSGVTRAGWFAGLAVVDVLLIGFAARRGGRGFLHPRRLRVRLPRVLPAVLSTAALAAVVGSVLLSVASAQRQERGSHFTQLWMLAATGGVGPAATIGVRNMEGATTSYRIVVRTRRKVLFSAPLRLGVSRSWSAEVPLSAVPSRTLVSATLYRAGKSTPYRVTDLWTPAL
jgi:hypothetical protein